MTNTNRLVALVRYAGNFGVIDGGKRPLEELAAEVQGRSPLSASIYEIRAIVPDGSPEEAVLIMNEVISYANSTLAARTNSPEDGLSATERVNRLFIESRIYSGYVDTRVQGSDYLAIISTGGRFSYLTAKSLEEMEGMALHNPQIRVHELFKVDSAKVRSYIDTYIAEWSERRPRTKHLAPDFTRLVTEPRL